MRIYLRGDPGVSSFADLYPYTIDLLGHVDKSYTRAIVLGPISNNAEASREKNVARMQRAVERLSKMGFAVLDITSYQGVIDRLMDEGRTAGTVNGYPYAVLEDFTLPLIRNRVFSLLHFMWSYKHSIGARREHKEAKRLGMPIAYVR